MMDPLENDLFALPDYEHTEDEDFPPLPPPHSPGAAEDVAGDMENGDDWTKNMGQTQPEETPKPTRRVVKRPQPKLDPQRLASKRGLPALRHLFDDTKFKGKGHEAEDLKVLVRQMENWAHRLFPKLQFEDFLNRLETLGNKKEVQMEDNNLDLDSEDFSALPESSPPSLSQPSTAELSEETLQRIERNRRLALEKRMQKIQAQEDSQALTPPPPLSQTQTPTPNLDEIPEDFDVDLLEEVDKAVEINTQSLELATSPVITEKSPTVPDPPTEEHMEVSDDAED